MIKADLHLHTGEDKFHKLKYDAYQLIDHLASKKFDAMAITCHRDVFFNKKIADYAKKKNLVLISGTERYIEGKEVLIYNITSKQCKSLHTFDDLRALKKKQNIMIIAPHPFFLRKNCLGKQLEKNIDLFDGIEYSHFYLPILNLNKKAVKIAKKYNKSIIGTSDAHDFSNIGKTYTLIDSKKSVDLIIKAIKKGKVKLKTKPLNYFSFIKKIFQVVLSTE